MLKFKTAFRLIRRNVIKQTVCRKYETKVDLDKKKLSVREQLWHDAQKKYANYPHIIYSSYVESQEEQFPWRMPKEKHRAMKTYKHLLNSHVQQDDNKVAPFPKNWMDDYEFYAGAIDQSGNINSLHGTADHTMPPSKVPCSGCGAHLHCASFSLPGYIPLEIFKGRTRTELKTIVCQRCHFLQHYNIALDVEVSPESYVQTIARIKDEFALAVVIVDLLDMPCSIWPRMQEILGQKRPVFIVGNKVDLLPRDSNGYLTHVAECLKQQMLQAGYDALNIQYLGLVSAKTGYGIEELITQLHKIWKHKGDVYLVGCTNVGKSSLFNVLLNSDYCRPEAVDLVKKATTCPWPGTTLQTLKFPILRPSEIRVYQRFRRLFSERGLKAAEAKLRRDQAVATGSMKAAKLIGNVGRTFDSREEVNDAFAMGKGTQPKVAFNEQSSEYQKAKWCYDTPGVMHPDQITNLLTTEELLQLEPSEMMRPRVFRLEPGMSLFLAGLGRLDFVDLKHTSEKFIRVFAFCSLHIPIVISPTSQADQMYRKYVGTELLGVPCGSEDRLASWPGLQCHSDNYYVVGTNEEGLSCDIMMSSVGWVGIKLPAYSEGMFKAWTPHARGIYLRSPALIRYAERLMGKRIRNSLAYNLGKSFVFKK